MNERATAESWKHLPLPARRDRLVLERHYDSGEYAALARGEVPSSQDDRWFTWVGDDHVVHIHRSWTGIAVYEVHLVPTGDGYDIAEAWVNADPEEHKREDPDDVVRLGRMLDWLARR
jgi:hypothetical protein